MPSFSWRRAAKHVAIPIVLVIVAMAALSTQAANPEKFGEACGQFLVFVLVVALAASYLAQTGRRRAAIGVSVAAVVAIGGLVVAIVATRPTHAKLSASDRMPLVESTEAGQRWLRHPALGFAFHHPGAGFVEAPQYADIMRASDRDAGSMYYAYADEQPSAILIVGMLAGMGDSRDSLEHSLDGIERGLRKSLASQLGSGVSIAISDRQVIWDDHRREATMHATIEGAHYRVHMFALQPTGKPPLVVALMVMSSDADALADVLTSLR
jgi:hypothetical protein